MGRTEISESALRAAADIRSAISRLRRRLLEASDARELTPSQTSLLSRLNKNGPASASELAAAERVRPQSVAATLSVLEERGFVQRRQDPDDGRRQLVSLSDAGNELVHDRRRAGQEWLARALQEEFTDAERRTIIDAMALLERLNQR